MKPLVPLLLTPDELCLLVAAAEGEVDLSAALERSKAAMESVHSMNSGEVGPYG